jgi:hypothetical protein
MEEAQHFKMKEQNCPVCGIKLDSVYVTPGERPPRPHDITVCWNCQEVLTLRLEESGLLSPHACTVEDISKWSMELRTKMESQNG